MKLKLKLLVLLCCLSFAVKSQVSVFAKVEHVIPDGIDTDGGITLTVSGSTAPYTYTWNPGAINTKDISGVAAGQYTLNVRSASSQTYTNSYKIGYKVLWTNAWRAINRNDSLYSSSASAAIFGVANSKNTLAASTDGWFEYVINVLSPTNHYIGFADSISPILNTFGDIDYGVYYLGSGQDLYSIHTGTASTLIKSNLKVGDVVRVERVGNVIRYLVNNAAVKTITVTGVSAKQFKLKAYMSGTNKINYVGCSFMGLSNVTMPNIVQLNHSIDQEKRGSANGLLKVVPYFPFANTYTWSPGGATTNSITGLSYGTYSITVRDSLNNESSYTYNVGYKAEWTDLDRCYFRNDSLVTNGITSPRYSSAATKNTLAPNVDGWFEYTVTYNSTYDFYLGFTDSLAPYSTYTNIDYGFFFDASTRYIHYYENAAGSTPLINYIRSGDVLRIERVGNVIRYKVNNVSLRAFTVSGISQKALKVQSNMEGVHLMTDIGCSFDKKDSTTFKNYVDVRPLIKHSSGFGISDGSIKVTPKINFTNTYTWSPGGATTNSVTSLGVGNYSVTIKDSLQNQSPFNFNVGYKVLWTNLDRCIFRNDSLIGTGNASQYSKAISKNVLKANQNGWVEMVMDKLGSYEYYFGFCDSLSPNAGATSFQDIDYGFYYTAGTAKYLYYYEKGTDAFITYVPRIGDVLRIERSGNNMYYKINGRTFRTVSAAGLGAKQLKLKASIEYVEKLCNIGCSFYNIDSSDVKNYVEVKPLIKHATTSVSNDGSISVSPKTSGLQSYAWQPTGSATALSGSLSPGAYTVTVQDSVSNKSTYAYNVGYKTIWKNLATGFFRNDTLKATATTSTFNYARTKNVLNSNTDGWFEFVVNSLPSYNNYIGFVDSAANNSGVTNDIQYGIYYVGTSASRYIYFYESGTQNTLTLTGKLGDIIRVERVGNTIRYLVNGQVLRTVTNVAIGPKVFRLKARLGYTNYLTHIGASFSGCILTVNAGTDKIIIAPGTTTIGATPSASGTPATYSYTWTPNSAITSTAAANPTVNPVVNTTYTLTVSNEPGCIVTDKVDVVVANTVTSYGILKKDIDGGYYKAVSSKVYFKFDEEYKGIGLSYKIYDYSVATSASGTAIGSITCSGLSSLTTTMGDNRFMLDLTTCGSLPSGKIYLLEVTNSKNEKFYLKFKV